MEKFIKIFDVVIYYIGCLTVGFIAMSLLLIAVFGGELTVHLKINWDSWSELMKTLKNK